MKKRTKYFKVRQQLVSDSSENVSTFAISLPGHFGSTEVEYDLRKALGIHVERAKKNFNPPVCKFFPLPASPETNALFFGPSGH